MKKFRDKYRIPPARLAGWDYSQPGLYYITICTKNRDHFFGEVINKEMQLNEIGITADNCWSEIPDHFENTTLGEFTIMPNHVHGIIIINDSVETGHALSPGKSKPETGWDLPQTGWDLPETGLDKTNSAENPPIETGHALSLPHPRFRNPGKNTISTMVGSFKSAVTKLSRPINPRFGWQTRFYDHIIRSHEDFVRISNYIKNNPANWNSDKFYK
jgi:REP element-mobilizing transposase RayT